MQILQIQKKIKMYSTYRELDGFKFYHAITKYLLIREEQKEEYGKEFTEEEAKAFLKKNTKYNWVLEKVEKKD